MAGTIRYGTYVFHVDSDTSLGYYRLLIQLIIQSGRSEWLPLTGTDEEGNSFTSDVLITAGVPFLITTETPEGADEVLKDLVDEYMNEPAAKRRESIAQA